MCAQYIIKTQIKDFERLYGVKSNWPDEILALRIVPHKQAPVITFDASGSSTLTMKQYSLVPSWSKEPKVKFATYNARIETLLAKPTWRKPLISHRCLVPMTGFIEPIYSNELAGNMVLFYPQSHELATAAGLWDRWVNEKTGESFDSFAIITQEAPKQIETAGHDRSPIFLNKKSFAGWLDPNNKEPKKILEFLREERSLFNFSWSVDRPMAKGWEKRIPKQENNV